jgi:hypothetical protein
MTETDSTPTLEKTCVAWSRRRERDIAFQVHYNVQEQDGCRIYTITSVKET